MVKGAHPEGPSFTNSNPVGILDWSAFRSMDSLHMKIHPSPSKGPTLGGFSMGLTATGSGVESQSKTSCNWAIDGYDYLGKG